MFLVHHYADNDTAAADIEVAPFSEKYDMRQ